MSQGPPMRLSARPAPVRLPEFSRRTRSSIRMTSLEYGLAAPARKDSPEGGHAQTVAIVDTEKTFPRLLPKERSCSMLTSRPTAVPWVQPMRPRTPRKISADGEPFPPLTEPTLINTVIPWELRGL